MLRYLRENTGNWIIKIFLGIIVIVFVFLGVGTMNSDRNNTVASINDDPITLNEFQDEYRNLVARYRIQFGDNLNEELLKMLNVKQQALDSLIEQRLLEAQAEKLNVIVSDRELQGVVMGVPSFQRDGVFNMEQYQNVLRVNSMTPEMFEQIQRRRLRQEKVMDMVAGSITVSDMEAGNWYRFRNAKAAVKYIKVDPVDLKDIKASEDQIKAEYDANKERYKSEPRIKAVYLRFSPTAYEAEVTIPEDRIKAYYEQNPDQYKTPEKVEARHVLIKVDEKADDEAVEKARQEAMAVYEKAKGGADFAQLAKDHSQGPSAEKGGFLGTFERKTMVKPFSDKAFSMKKGEVSEPVRTQFGWHVIKVTDRFEAKTTPFEEAAETIRKMIAEKEMQNLAYDAAGRAFDSVIDGDSLEQVALISKKEVMATGSFDRSGKGLELDKASEFAAAAFATPLDEISDVKQLGDDYYLIKVVQTIAPSGLPLDAVKEKIAGTLTGKLRTDAARQKAAGLLEKAKTAETLESAAKEAGLTVLETKPFTRSGAVKEVGRSDKFNTAAFSLTKEKPLYGEVLQTDKGFFVIALKEKNLPLEKEIEENLETARQQLIAAKQRQYYQDWMAELKKAHKVEVNPQFIN